MVYVKRRLLGSDSRGVAVQFVGPIKAPGWSRLAPPGSWIVWFPGYVEVVENGLFLMRYQETTQ